eukprot:Opistho-2@92260
MSAMDAALRVRVCAGAALSFSRHARQCNTHTASTHYKSLNVFVIKSYHSTEANKPPPPTDCAEFTATCTPIADSRRRSYGSFVGTKLFADAKKVFHESATHVHATRRKCKTARGTPTTDYLNGLRAYYNENSDVGISTRSSKTFKVEDDRRIVEMIKEGKGWTDIGREFGKNGKAIFNRCAHSLDPRLHFGPFTAEEDAAIHAHVREHGEGKWTELWTKMGHTRSARVLRSRYTFTLQPDVKKGPWSDDERRRLLEGIVKHARDWVAVAGHVGTGRT